MLYAPAGRLGWDPFAEIRRMQDDVRRIFTGFEGRTAAQAFPPVNLWVGRDSAVVTAELPGVAADNIELSAQDDALTIRGRVEPVVEAESVTRHRRERSYGTFSRTIELPFLVDPDNVQARFTNGVLEVELQRPESDKPKRIAIDVH